MDFFAKHIYLAIAIAHHVPFLSRNLRLAAARSGSTGYESKQARYC